MVCRQFLLVTLWLLERLLLIQSSKCSQYSHKQRDVTVNSEYFICICYCSYCGAYTMDVIASTAFGIEIDSHNDPKNQFVQNCKEIFKFSFGSPRILIFCMFLLVHFLCCNLAFLTESPQEGQITPFLYISI